MPARKPRPTREQLCIQLSAIAISIGVTHDPHDHAKLGALLRTANSLCARLAREPRGRVDGSSMSVNGSVAAGRSMDGTQAQLATAAAARSGDEAG